MLHSAISLQRLHILKMCLKLKVHLENRTWEVNYSTLFCWINKKKRQSRLICVRERLKEDFTVVISLETKFIVS